MGLSENQKRLIQAISLNDIKSAKRWAVECIAEDKTAKNKWFCSKYKTVLESSGLNMVELPNDLKNILCVEDVSNSFKEARYYISAREKAAFENIVSMKKVSEKLMEMSIPYLNSTLLYGESGTGKTTFGRYVAYKAGLPFCYLKFSDLVDSYLGSTSKNISKVFSYAVSNPCVLMLDEIDCISIRRSSSDSGGSSGEMARITITIMQEFDRLTNDMIVVGATNRKDSIDEALLRRFSLKHEVIAFDKNEKVQMANKYLDDIGMKFSETEINELVENSENQSVLLNKIIRMITSKILESEASNEKEK